MLFVACGLNHKTAPLEVRETMALSSSSQDKLLLKLLDETVINEAAVLSTCNRTEFYCMTPQPDKLIPWLAHQYKLPMESLSPYFYSFQGHHGIRHALRVASGLDSMMLGEPQILGQMKQAYQQACRTGVIKNKLRSVFEYIFSASKRIRTQSGIGANPVSIAYAAVQLAGQFFKDFKSVRVFLIGSGETAHLVAKYLHKQGVSQFLVASRTQENASQLAASFGAKALSISDIPQYLTEADLVISATACPLPFINKNLVEHALVKRRGAPMFFLDLAVPRDIEADVGDLPQVALYNIDDLQFMITEGMNERKTAALQAEQLIDIELDNYIRKHRALKAKDLICEYRDQMQYMAQLELDRALTKLSSGKDQKAVMQELCQRLVNKLTHYPTIGVKKAGWDDREELVDLARYLFNTSNRQVSHEEIP